MPEKEEQKLESGKKTHLELEETQSRGDATTKLDTISMVSGEDGDQRMFRKQMNKLNLYD